MSAPKWEEECFRGRRSRSFFPQGEFMRVHGVRVCSQALCPSALSRTQARFAVMFPFCDGLSVGSFLWYLWNALCSECCFQSGIFLVCVVIAKLWWAILQKEYAGNSCETKPLINLSLYSAPNCCCMGFLPLHLLVEAGRDVRGSPLSGSVAGDSRPALKPLSPVCV